MDDNEPSACVSAGEDYRYGPCGEVIRQTGPWPGSIGSGSRPSIRTLVVGRWLSRDPDGEPGFQNASLLGRFERSNQTAQAGEEKRAFLIIQQTEPER